MISEKELELEIQDKGLNAPRLTPELIDSKIKEKSFYKLTERLTVCVVTLKNGFELIGESSCVSADNYNKEIGEKISFENARNKIWELEGYLLKENLFIKSNK